MVAKGRRYPARLSNTSREISCRFSQRKSEVTGWFLNNERRMDMAGKLITFATASVASGGRIR
jgi:hypothetical protein